MGRLECHLRINVTQLIMSACTKSMNVLGLLIVYLDVLRHKFYYTMRFEFYLYDINNGLRHTFVRATES